MKKEDIILKLKNHALFYGIEENALEIALEDPGCTFASFKQGDIIFSPDTKEKKLGFILGGEACVYSEDGSHSVILRSLKEGDSFGISNLFDEEIQFVSRIIAKRSTTVIFFTPVAVKKMLDESSTFRLNYIKFLSERIRFLNKKISCFTAGSPERKLATFLCAQMDEKCYSLSVNANSLSEMLDIGRASLYRAFDKLIADGHITKSGKNITVLDKEALKKAYN